MAKQNAEFTNMCVNTSHHPCRLRLNKCMISTDSADSSMAAPGIMASTALYSEPANHSLLSWIWSPKVYKFPMPIFCPGLWCFFFNGGCIQNMSKPKQIITLLGFLQYVLHLAFRRIDGVNDFWGEQKTIKTLKGFFGLRKASSSWKIYTPWPMNFASGQGGHYKVYGGPSLALHHAPISMTP